MALFGGLQIYHTQEGLYFDGHDHADVVEYCQNMFLPTMKEYERQLIQYVVGDADQEMLIPCRNYVEPCLVLLPQDKMTAQANNILAKMWVFDNCAKRARLWSSQSDMICSTVD
jgi:hypothetical protein